MRTGQLYYGLFEQYQLATVRSVARAMQRRITHEWLPGRDFRGKKILNIGCGAGKYCLAFENLGADVTGVNIHDAAAPVIARFVHANALALPFGDESFEFTWSSGALHHTKDPVQAIAEQVRVTKTGAELFIALYRNTPYFWGIYLLRPLRFVVPQRYFEKFLHFDTDNIYVPNIHVYTKRELDRLFASFGLAVHAYHKGTYMHRYVLYKLPRRKAPSRICTGE